MTDESSKRTTHTASCAGPVGIVARSLLRCECRERVLRTTVAGCDCSRLPYQSRSGRRRDHCNSSWVRSCLVAGRAAWRPRESQTPDLRATRVSRSGVDRRRTCGVARFVADRHGRRGHGGHRDDARADCILRDARARIGTRKSRGRDAKRRGGRFAHGAFFGGRRDGHRRLALGVFPVERAGGNHVDRAVPCVAVAACSAGDAHLSEAVALLCSPCLPRSVCCRFAA